MSIKTLKKAEQIKCYPVNSERNSICSVRLCELDWSNWFTDSSYGSFYLHINSKDGDIVHRVMCKRSFTPRLKLSEGKLYWLIP